MMQYDMTKQKLTDQYWPKQKEEKKPKRRHKKQKGTFLHTQESYKEVKWIVAGRGMGALDSQ